MGIPSNLSAACAAKPKLCEFEGAEGGVYIRKLTVQDADDLADSEGAVESLAFFIGDENNKRVVTTAEDIDELRHLPKQLGENIMQAGMEYNRLGHEAAEEEIEQVVGNS